MALARALNRALGWLGPDRTVAERVALFAAAASVGPSFEPGLQPRKTIHQALATGLISASTLTAVTATQSAIESVSRRMTSRLGGSRGDGVRLVLTVGSSVAIAAAGQAVARALPPREDERARRGLARVAASRSSQVALVGAALTAGVGGVDVLTSRDPNMRFIRRMPIALSLGIAASAFEIRRVHRRARAFDDETIIDVSTGKATGIALGVGAGVVALQGAERSLARGVAGAIKKVAPSYDNVSNPIGHLVSLGVLGGIFIGGYEYVVRRVEQGGAAIEPAYDRPPTSELVSGGPGSVVTFDSLSREGRRFCNMVLTRSEIETVVGEPVLNDPIRVFVGLDSATELEDRVDLVMDELVRTKAFDRSVLAIASPTGSGYINYVFAESLEYMTRGDCAIATMQYSLLPSPMSMTRTRLAVEQNRALMHAVTGYLRGMDPDKRPKLVLFGESLGALTLQDVWRHRTAEAIDRDFVHSSIFLGTPSATEFAKSWRFDPERIDPQGKIVEIDNYGDVISLPADRQGAVRHFLLSHYDDPIPKFGTNLLMRRPWWLGPPETRPPRVPKSSNWRAGTTFVLTSIDMMNAMEVIPGQFGRRGHDYREDIARFVSHAYELPVASEQLLAIEHALRERELEWAQRRVVTEQVARAKEALLREMKSWNVSGAPVDLSADAIVDQLLGRPDAEPVDSAPATGTGG